MLDPNKTFQGVNNGCEYMKIIYMHCSLKEEYRIDPRSYEHY